jgi:hypothetical protein
VNNCGDILLNNVTVVNSRGAQLLTPGGLPLPQFLQRGGTVAFKGSFVPTLAETCGGSADITITARGTDDTIIGGPNASVTNSTTVSCAICAIPCLTGTHSGGQFNLSFASVPGRPNSVQYADSLPPSNWQLLTNFLGNGSIVTITDRAPNQVRFYRVLVQ